MELLGLPPRGEKTSHQSSFVQSCTIAVLGSWCCDLLSHCPTVYLILSHCPTTFVPLTHYVCPTTSVPLSHYVCPTVPPNGSSCLEGTPESSWSYCGGLLTYFRRIVRRFLVGHRSGGSPDLSTTRNYLANLGHLWVQYQKVGHLAFNISSCS